MISFRSSFSLRGKAFSFRGNRKAGGRAARRPPPFPPFQRAHAVMSKAVAAAGVAAAAGVRRPLIPSLGRRSLSSASLAQQLRFGDADPERQSRTRILRAARAPRPTALQCPLFASSSGRPSPCAHVRYMALSSASSLSRSPRSCHASVALARDRPPMEYALLTAPRSSFGPSSIAFCPLWSACRPWTYGVQLTL